MDTSPKYDFPWKLISESLTGNLSVEEELQLKQWFSSDPVNKEKYLQIQELWKNGMEDYQFYQKADENEAWKSLHIKITKEVPGQNKTKVIHGQFTQRPKLIRNLIAIAAVFIGFICIGVWFVVTRNNPVFYETALNEQKKVSLNDGTTITLQQLSKIEVGHDYNKSDRTIIMVSGVAFFDVVHHSDKPFIVELGTTRIKDIGTSFTIHKKAKEIMVSVSSGKIEFVKLATKETRELNAGSGITYDVENEHFGIIKQIELSNVAAELLNFEDTPLSEVIISIQKVYGKKVIINDSIANKKITAQLYGMPYNTALKVICKSLGLEFSLKDSVYTLTTKKIEQP